ncbi:MAG: class 3 adenylate cyclase/TolB-like protein [Paracoccaceae bacterium]|jgi:class 3 adenylate cyclase/TolB-like protein
MERRLAAILAADVVGYSRLMGADEAGVLSALRALRAELFDPTVAKHRGRIVKLMGDGVLVEFASVVDAVNCAAEVQEELATRNSDRPENQRLQLRIGVNLGDLMVDGDDLYGDGVNVAARLEAEAEPGGICVSQAVVDQARGKVQVGFMDLGERRLKNIAAPVRLYRIVADPAVGRAPAIRPRRPRAIAAAVLVLALSIGAGWIALAPSAAPALDISKVLSIKGPMVAVLPFENRGDAADDGFASGMAEQISAALTRFNGIRVLSLRLAASNAGSIPDLRKLGARYLVEGSVVRTDKALRVSLSMTNAVSGDQIWAETFKADLTPRNVYDVQEAVAGKIAASLTSGDQSPILVDRLKDAAGKPPEGMEALDCVHSDSNWASPAGMRRVYGCLLKTIEADPGYAEGFRLLSDIYLTDYYWDYRLRTDDAYDPRSLTLAMAQRAAEIAPASAGSHDQLASAYFANGQYDRFETEAKKAIELNPNDASMIGSIGMLVSFTGRYEEGNALIRKALDFNPSVVNTNVYYALAKEHYLKGDYAEAMAEFRKTFIPGFWLNDLVSAYTYSAWGKQKEAEAAVASLLKKRPDLVIEDAI